MMKNRYQMTKFRLCLEDARLEKFRVILDQGLMFWMPRVIYV